MWKKLVGAASSALLVVALVPCVALAEAAADSQGEATAAGESAGYAASWLVPGDADLLFAQSVQANYSWYVGHEGDSSYTLANTDQVLGFANLVNGLDGKSAVTFAGKTISLSAATYAFQGMEWTPVGDASHPFQGTFNGNGATLTNFKVSGANRSAYLGFFGFVGASGKVMNVTVGSGASVSATRDAGSSDVIHHVAGVAGYCGGTVSGCSNAAPVTVASSVVQTASAPQPVYAVGGVAGECVFSMSGCSNSAAINVSQTSDPVGSVDDSGLVHFVGGVVGILGDSGRVGTSSAAVPADPAKHGSLSNSSNTGKVTVNTPSEAGLDRFGSTAFARSVCVGGVAGYSQGSVTNCTNGAYAGSTGSNSGYVCAEHATSAGGIVGSLRGLIGSDNPTTRANQDDGMASTSSGHDALVVANCTNYGDVYALNAAGGIAGYAGTYTTIKGCVNSAKSGGDTWVVATRWNKPAPAGIVGSTCGDVAFCANLGKVASGSWSNEGSRTITTASGYYAAGIAGMLSYYSQVNSETYAIEVLSPIPEVYACYNAGSILAVSGMRQRGIVGENDGRVHNCALLSGTVENDKIAYGEDASDTEASGAVYDNKVYSAADLKGAAPLALMNAAASSSDYQGGFYWAKSAQASAAGNFGYPVLSTSPAAPSRTSIAGATVTVAENARYNGATGGNEAAPALSVKLGSTTLVEGVDYYVKPQSGAVNIGSGYKAVAVGIGAYKDQTGQVSYSIGKGYLQDCVMTVTGATFNYNAQYPTSGNVTVKTASGVTIDPGEYEIVELKDRDGNVTTEPVNRGNYTLTIRVKQGSAHFDTSTKTTLTGTYRISPADIMRVIDFSKVSISFEGTTYPWVSSTDEADVDHPRTTLPYTGWAVKPAVSQITYNGHTLVENVDYRIVYGNPNSGEGDTGSHDLNNLGKKGGTTVGCVTVRFVTNSNFSNYVNMFFNIADEGSGYTTMHRLYNPYSGEHLYTSSADERDFLASIGWNAEGTAWIAPNSGAPVYRLYNPYSGDHHYTTSADERDFLASIGWNAEGTGWYSYDESGAPLYRMYNPYLTVGTHHYTVGADERDFLASIGWNYEGVGWYGLN